MAALSIRGFNVATRIHGRVLVRKDAAAVAVLAGFHGYMENAEIQMDRLEALPVSGRATLVSVQGLNRFYRGRREDVVVETLVYPGGHEWTMEVAAAASRFLGRYFTA